jgi:hypothetical protein
MATNRIVLLAVYSASRASARGVARLIAGFVIFSHVLLLITDASPVGGEVGTNDFRISDMGPLYQSWPAALNPAIAYNSTNNEYLAVWQGDDVYDECFEIYGQRINAATGAEIGTDFRISDMGASDTDARFQAKHPAVAYSSTQHEYLVVWSGDDTTDFELEIYGQRLDASDGSEVGNNDFRISDMGDNDGDTAFSATVPALAYNSVDNEYLVVWQGDDTSPGNNDLEIYGQRLDASDGTEVGANDFRISDMGTADGATFAASDPAVAYNRIDNEYLVVWDGDDDSGSLVDAEFEIYGQRLDATDGSEVGDNDFRVSNIGTDGSRWFGAEEPAVVYNSVAHEYLVVWQGDSLDLTNAEFEIYGQRLRATTAAEVGRNDFRISDMGSVDGDHDYDADSVSVAYVASDNEYVVVWHGDDDTAPLANGDFEIFGQRLSGATGAELGENDFRISDMGSTDGDGAYEARDPGVACGIVAADCLVVWSGDDDTAPLVNGEFEVFGQRIMLPALRYFAWD